MTFKSSFLYASKLLRPSKRTASNGRKSLFGAIFGIALSIVPLVVVLIVSDGMIEGITNRLIGLSTYHMQAVQTLPLNFTEEEHVEMLQTLRADIESIKGVENAFVERQGVALAVGKTGRTGATIRSVENDFFTRNNAFGNYVDVIDGVADFPTSKSVVIGKKIAETLELTVGDSIRLMTTKTLSNGSVSPKMLSCKVSGIVSSGYEEIDGLWVFMPLETGFSYLSSASSQVKIGIETVDAFSTDFSRIGIDTMQKLPAGFYVYRWNDLNSAQFENYASTKMLLLLIMFLILLIASVNISAAIIMTTMERQKEIAILKSIGATRSGITYAFLIVGFFCGLVGLLIGLPIGIVLGLNFNSILHFFESIVNCATEFWYSITGQIGFSPIVFLSSEYYLQNIELSIPPVEILSIIIGTLVLSMIVSIAPSVKAGKEKPLDLLRKI